MAVIIMAHTSGDTRGDPRGQVVGGVDTHAETHMAAVVDSTGRILGVCSFPTSPRGCADLLSWMEGFGDLLRVGIEGTGSYGAGLTRHLLSEGIDVVEVLRPNRQLRRRRGKSDPTDAEAAARAALNGEASGRPKSADGPVEALRALRMARRSAVKASTQASNQIRDLLVSAPSSLRESLGPLPGDARIAACARLRPGVEPDPTQATKRSLRLLARRHLALRAEIAELDEAISGACWVANPALLATRGVGPDVASSLLVAAGDNPTRMRSESCFAALCGVSPVEASSGKVSRHRLNRGGNREANNALWRIVMVRLAHRDERTLAYFERRRTEGKTHREVLRCLKRHVAREVYRLLADPPTILSGTDVRERRTDAQISLDTLASAVGTTRVRLSRLERGVVHDAELARLCHEWLIENTTASSSAA
jgi:transposase